MPVEVDCWPVVPLSLDEIVPGGGFSSGMLGVAEPEFPESAITIPTIRPVTTAAMAMITKRCKTGSVAAPGGLTQCRQAPAAVWAVAEVAPDQLLAVRADPEVLRRAG